MVASETWVLYSQKVGDPLRYRSGVGENRMIVAGRKDTARPVFTRPSTSMPFAIASPSLGSVPGLATFFGATPRNAKAGSSGMLYAGSWAERVQGIERAIATRINGAALI